LGALLKYIFFADTLDFERWHALQEFVGHPHFLAMCAFLAAIVRAASPGRRAQDSIEKGRNPALLKA
jgi:hypothetical protein